MGWIDRWDIVLALVAAYIAVMAIVRLMAQRRNQDVADVERQIEAIRKQSNHKRGSKKGRGAA